MSGTIRSQRRLFIPCLLALFGALLFPPSALAQSPRGSAALPSLPAFVTSVINGDPGVLRGVYADGLFALPVVQQPRAYPAYVSSTQNSVTQFGMAAHMGNVGLLAHNYLSGRAFFDLRPGQAIELIYGQGRVDAYHVTQIYSYQAEDPRSPSSDFVDLDNHALLSADQLFQKVYAGPTHLTFQTCITRDGNSSWGRLFVIATPTEPPVRMIWGN